jgi:hypothetical protein
VGGPLKLPLQVHKPVISRPKLLLVEGRDEEEFFRALLDHLAVTDVQPDQFRGKANLREDLKGLRGRSGFGSVTSLAITRDANSDAQAAFQSVRDALRDAGFETPQRCEHVVGQSPKLSVFILPDCTSPGMLETLCLRSVQDQPGMKCVRSYFRCMKKNGRDPKNPWKAQIHAWLASDDTPDRRLGEAARAKRWDFDHGSFAQLRRFLTSI